MSKKEEKQKAKQSFFIREVRRLSKKDIREKEEEEGRKLNRKEKDKIVKKKWAKSKWKNCRDCFNGSTCNWWSSKRGKNINSR